MLLSKFDSTRPCTRSTNKYVINANPSMDSTINKYVIVTIEYDSDQEYMRSLKIEKHMTDLFTNLEKGIHAILELTGDDHIE